MATRAVTIRLSEQDISTLDGLASYFARSGELAAFAGAAAKPTRSDMIRACVTGWLTDHHAVVEKMLSKEAS